MRTTTALTLGQAATACGRSKTAVLRAIQKGKLSAEKDETGQYAIEPAELFRVFTRAPDTVPVTGTEDGTARNPDVTTSLQREIDLLRDTSERERHQYEETVSDLRRRLDAAEKERGELVRTIREQAEQAKLLTDQRHREQEGPRREEVETLRRELEALRQQQLANPTNKRRGLLARLFGGE